MNASIDSIICNNNGIVADLLICTREHYSNSDNNL